MRRIWRLWAGIALCAATTSAPLPAVGAAPSAPSTAQILRGLAPAVDPIVADLVDPGDGGPAPALPPDPDAALGGGVTRLGARLGVALDPRPALVRAHLAPALAGRLALLLATLGSCMPARGCVNPVFDLHEGQCVIAAALLLDMAGNDTYGRVKPPEPDADGWCTDDPLVQRIMTEGAGFAGVGVLIDAAGDDTYVGKTMAQGAGHAGGVGILRDE